MLTRIISSAVLTVIAAAVLVGGYFAPVVLTAAIALLCMTASYELAGVTGIKENVPLASAGIIGAGALVFFESTEYLPLCIIVYFLAAFSLNVLCKKRKKFSDTAAFLLMTSVVSLSLGTGSVMVQKGDITKGIIYIILGTLSAWLADIGGYFGGRLFGKHPLCPDISPKKTKEGVLGGIVTSLVCFMAIGFVLDNVFSFSVSFLALAVLSFCAAFISVAGDLTFSLIKREYGIKDYGKLIPGHGGILDRFDGVVFTLPIAYLIASYLPIL